MAKVGAQRAAELTGKSKSTIQRAMNTGKLSYEVDANSRRIIDVSELERVYGLGNAGAGTGSSSSAPVSSQALIDAELKRATDMIDMERMKMKIKALEDQLELTNTTMEDLRGQRDQWQKQAQQVLITSQYSQKQAEELKAELKSREEIARKRREEREKIMADRMRKMEGQGQNQNTRTSPQQPQQARPSNAQPTQQRPGGQDRGRVLTEESMKKPADIRELLDFQALWKKIKGEKAA